MGRSLHTAERGGGEGKRGEVCRGRQGAAGPQGKPFSAGERFRRPEAAGFGEAEPGLRAPSLRLAGGAPGIYLWRGEKKLAPAGGIFERNVKFAAEAKKCAKPLDFFAEMITIVYG